MNGTHVITSPPYSSTCLKGDLTAKEDVQYGIVGAVRTVAVCNFLLCLPKCESEPFGICYRHSNRAGG